MEPGDRRLARPPSERFGVREEPRAAAPSISRAVLFGVAAAALLSFLWLFFAGVLGTDYGAIVLAAIGGWGVGTAVAYGAWGERPHDPFAGLRVAAVGLALGAWLGGTALDWVWSQATLPGSAQSLAERLAQTPFVDWFAGQLSVLTVLQVGLVALLSWRAAR